MTAVTVLRLRRRVLARSGEAAKLLSWEYFHRNIRPDNYPDPRLGIRYGVASVIAITRSADDPNVGTRYREIVAEAAAMRLGQKRPVRKCDCGATDNCSCDPKPPG